MYNKKSYLLITHCSKHLGFNLMLSLLLFSTFVTFTLIFSDYVVVNKALGRSSNSMSLLYSL
nr:MAG TPA: hypothetical protein [Caudoviricetes sp.]